MNEACAPAPVIERDGAAALMEPLTDLVIRAGAAIIAVNRAAMTVEGKLDGSPVTEADLASDRIIADGLARLIPGLPALSEERAELAKPRHRRPAAPASRQAANGLAGGGAGLCAQGGIAAAPLRADGPGQGRGGIW